MRFGEFLLSRKMLTESALESALESQRFVNVKLGRALKELGHIKPVVLDQELNEFFRKNETAAGQPVLSGLKELKGRSKKHLQTPKCDPSLRPTKQSLFYLLRVSSFFFHRGFETQWWRLQKRNFKRIAKVGSSMRQLFGTSSAAKMRMTKRRPGSR